MLRTIIAHPDFQEKFLICDRTDTSGVIRLFMEHSRMMGDTLAVCGKNIVVTPLPIYMDKLSDANLNCRLYSGIVVMKILRSKHGIYSIMFRDVCTGRKVTFRAYKRRGVGISVRLREETTD